VSAVDYLVKPIVESRLEMTLEKLRSRKVKQTDLNYDQLLSLISTKQSISRFAVRLGI
jgi:response regulator of citrate/malate metabolism